MAPTASTQTDQAAEEDRAAALQRDKCKLLRLVNRLCQNGDTQTIHLANTSDVIISICLRFMTSDVIGLIFLRSLGAFNGFETQTPNNISAQDDNATLTSDVFHLMTLMGEMGNISGHWEREQIMDDEVFNRLLFQRVLDNGEAL